MTYSMVKWSLPKAALRAAFAAVVAVGMAGTAQVGKARANDWVGPAIVGAIIGGAIAHHAYRHRHYGARYGCCAPYPRKKWAKHRRYNYPPAYYPAVVIPLPFLAVRPGW